ncbi:alpha-2-macroglobulin receptor-associated protein-like [Thamnophis elegans]|uniref:alpha-2-macroglobulin receptor-associated protein-like n=1 Tax=Thamnophis elegans TaxID=35005 RepID=UPI001378DE94|nr:alpha-2-macroglobulin receptor-associated protein-like [Thamnophis elegans]
MAAPVLPLLLLLLKLLLAGTEAGGGLYSREANEAAASSPSAEFRLVRLNQLWEKAQRVGLPAVRLAELHSDLRLQEKDELSWKKLKAAGMDEDGEREARLRRRLEVIMTKYGLSGKKEGQQWETNHIKEGFAQDGLGDPRLEKLWNKARSSGKFSDEELEKLWREFQHHKEKVHEYNILLETMSRTEDVHKNTIDQPLEEESAAWKELLHRKHSELKEQLHSINQGFERLRKVSHQGYDSASEFEEPRVMDLWDLAQSTNFTEKELESLREELKHFEAKVEKHHHYQKQLEISHQKLKHVEGTGDKEHLIRNKEKYTMLEEKTKELGYKVKKHLQDLSGRISRGLQHNEL